jgi:hypothetical protein
MAMVVVVVVVNIAKCWWVVTIARCLPTSVYHQWFI